MVHYGTYSIIVACALVEWACGECASTSVNVFMVQISRVAHNHANPNLSPHPPPQGGYVFSGLDMSTKSHLPPPPAYPRVRAFCGPRLFTTAPQNLQCRGIRHVSPEGKDLVRRLLAKDPEDRPSARQMLAHPWLRAVMTRAKVATRQQRQPRRRRELTEVAWAAAPSAGVATTAAAGGSASVVEGGEGDAMPARRQSPPRATRRPAIGQGRREDGAGVTVAAAQAAASAAVASVTGSDTLPA